MTEIGGLAIFGVAVGANHLADGIKCNISLDESETKLAYPEKMCKQKFEDCHSLARRLRRRKTPGRAE